MIRAVLLLAVLAWPGFALAGTGEPCLARYGVPLVFPGETVEAARVQLAATRGWGITERVSLEASTTAPSPLVLAVALPKGSINPKNPDAPRGGMGLRWRPDVPPAAIAACLSYSLYLPEDFAFNKGGKLPGLFGGNAPAGGKTADGAHGFSVRLMWRAKGLGEVYAYIPGHPEGRGASLDRGAWTYPRGRWIEIQEEVVLNAPGTADGSLRIWIDGDLRLTRTDLIYRTTNDLGISGVMADIFYGGRTAEWAAPKDTVIRITPFRLSWR